MILQIPAGRLAEMFGSKWIFGGGILLGALANILAPILVRLNIYYFIAIRVFQGMLGGLALPTMHPMIAAWTPKCERARVATFIYSGCELGTVITLPGKPFLFCFQVMRIIL